MKVLKAISSPQRLQILNLVLERGPLSYTELMGLLHLSPSRDAGRFAYHLKYLLRADLLEPDVKTKKYRLTDLGRMIIDMAEDVEEQISKRRKMFVRTSRLAMEEFDRDKIAESLVREAGVPLDLAQKIARETEGRLLEFKTKYLTAPLIREFVNAILIEKGLEEYRHKLTRLGLPVYDVTQLIRTMGATSLGVEALHKAAGDAVLEEYTLLAVLPRDIADAHLSGTLHLNSLGSWILKPNEFMHDLRFFLQGGLNLGREAFTGPAFPPPKSFESALLMVSNLLKIAATEISGEQNLDFFNVFLAPLTKGLPNDRIKEGLRLFIHNLDQSLSDRGSPIEASLGLELLVPEFLGEKEAFGPEGKAVGTYADFAEETRLLVTLLLEVMSEEGGSKPVFNPSLIIKARPEAIKSRECEDLLFKSHELATGSGTPYFANLCPQNQRYASYTATGCRLGADWTEDWELDTLRTGSMDSVVINLPRLSYDGGKEKTQFLELLDDRLEMALRALEIKHQMVNQRLREGLLPFLAQRINGDHYFRLENAAHPISFVGLNEAVKSLSGKYLYEDEGALNLAQELISSLLRAVQRYEKPQTRVYLSMASSPEAAERLAELDVERYGWMQVQVQGTREKPFYTDMAAAPLEAPIFWKERINVEGRFHELTPGGHLTVIQLADKETDPNNLLLATKYGLETHNLGLCTYGRNLVHCNRCQKTFFGILSKCPLCGSVNTLVCFGRVSGRYSPISQWTTAKRLLLEKRVAYTLNSG